MNEWRLDPRGEPGILLRECLEAAIAAPSLHNSQPWRFRVRDNVIEVLADWSRQVPVLDPSGRELLISVGAALLNLRLSILARGRMPVQYLLPDPNQPELAARITIGPPAPVTPDALLLANAIDQRHSNRGPLAGVAVPTMIIDELTAAARTEGGTFVLLGADLQQAVLSLVRTAEHRRNYDPDYLAELDRWTRSWPGRRDGVPEAAFPPHSRANPVPLRDFGLLHPVLQDQPASFETTPTVGLLYSQGDSPALWLRTGQALERLWLTATVRGIRVSLMTQPIEYPQLRQLLEDEAHARSAQAIIRLGFGPIGATSPRRPLEEVMQAVLA